MAVIEKSWEESICDKMIAIIRRSEFKRDILHDADEFFAEGYAMVVALKMALNYWAADPITGKVKGIDT